MFSIPEPVLTFPHPQPPASGTTTEIAPGVLWLRMPLPFALDHINLWLVADDADRTSWTVIDCGYGNAVTREIWEQHFSATLRGRPVSRVVVTHCHPDHLGNADWFGQRFGAPMWITLPEYLSGHALVDERGGYGPERASAFFAEHGLAPDVVAAQRARGNTFARGVPSVPFSFQRILPHEMLRIGGRRWRVIPGYGHSNEHAALYCESLGVLISGDMLLPKISTNVSVWCIEPDGNPLRMFLDSIQSFLPLPDSTLVLPSHGIPFVGIRTRVLQLEEHHRARLAELEAAIGEATSAADVVPVLFRRQLDAQQLAFALGEAVAHLNFLWRDGRIRRDRRSDGHYLFARMSPAPNGAPR